MKKLYCQSCCVFGDPSAMQKEWANGMSGNPNNFEVKIKSFFKKKKMNLFGYTYKIYDIGYKTEMMSKECNAGDPLETPGGLYRGPPSNENTIFKKMCMPNIKFKSVQCSFTMNVNQLQ